MNVILEGPDNAGKTTLASTLIAELKDGVTYFHPGGAPKSIEAEIACCDEQYAKLLHADNLIIDRVTPISQRVYNPNTEYDTIRKSWWDRFADTKPVIIYCRPSTDRLMRVQDFTWREEETEEHRQKIITNQHTFIQRYDEIMRTIPNVCYDFDDPSSEVIKSKLVRAFNGSTVDKQWFYDLLSFRG